MARVAATDVYNIGIALSVGLDPFIAAASVIVDSISDCYPAQTLFEIERWLTAHLSTCGIPLKTEISTPDYASKFQRSVGVGLDSSSYGQQVRIFDSKGLLSPNPIQTQTAQKQFYMKAF